MNNINGAGRKPVIDESMITDAVLLNENGKPIAQIALEYGVSRQALTKRIKEYHSRISGIIESAAQWEKYCSDFKNVDAKQYNLHLFYMIDNFACTGILADYMTEKVKIVNYTDDPILRAFGVKLKPDWDDYNAFLESRCFPKSRENLKMVLDEMKLDNYDPIMIIEKTQGRMAEDNFYLDIKRFTGRVNYA